MLAGSSCLRPATYSAATSATQTSTSPPSTAATVCHSTSRACHVRRRKVVEPLGWWWVSQPGSWARWWWNEQRKLAVGEIGTAALCPGLLGGGGLRTRRRGS